MPMHVSENLRRSVRKLKIETYTLYLTCRHPRVPWYAKFFTACVVAYAFSPIDLIPDFIPILGHLDELVIVPLGIILARRMIPKSVLDECRLQAEALASQKRSTDWRVVVIIVIIWVLLAILVGVFFVRLFHRPS